MRDARLEKKLLKAQREARAVELRVEHKSYQEVADELGLPSRQAARELVQHALERVQREQDQDAATLVARQELELERVAARLLQVLNSDHYLVRAGEVVTLDGVPVVDDAPALAAAGRLVDVQARWAKLRGLDAPARTEARLDGSLRVDYTYQGVDTDSV